MKRVKSNIPLFAVCIDNSGYLASLELHKIYRVLPDERAAADDLLGLLLNIVSFNNEGFAMNIGTFKDEWELLRSSYEHGTFEYTDSSASIREIVTSHFRNMRMSGVRIIPHCGVSIIPHFFQ